MHLKKLAYTKLEYTAFEFLTIIVTLNFKNIDVLTFTFY